MKGKKFPDWLEKHADNFGCLCWPGYVSDAFEQDTLTQIALSMHCCSPKQILLFPMSSKRQKLCPRHQIKPQGSAFLENYGDCRALGRGQVCLDDEFLQLFLLEYLDICSLNNLAQASKYFYVSCYNDSLWKELTLRLVASKQLDLGIFQHTWRNTFKYLWTNQKSCIILDTPITVNNFYSDFLFAPIHCASLAPDKLQSLDTIPIVDHPSVQEFHQTYAKLNTPCIITNAINDWQCLGLDLKSLADRFADVKFRAEAIDISMSDYQSYADNCGNNIKSMQSQTTAVGDESPLLIFDKLFCEKCPVLATEYQNLKYFTLDLFGVLQAKRPDFRWLIAGVKRSGSTFHIDPNQTSAWNAVLSGSKKWILYPPHIRPPGVFTDASMSMVTAPVSLSEWYIHYYDQVVLDIQKSQKTGIQGPLEGTCRAGEVMYVPSGWWHCVINLEDCVAITQNFVDEFNLGKVLRFLRDKRDQVSGYGECIDDGCFEVFKGNNLYEDFVEKLQNSKFAEILQEITLDIKERKPIVWEQSKSFKFQFNS